MLQRDQELNKLQSHFEKLNSRVLSFETEENILITASKMANKLDLTVHIKEYFDRLLFHLYCSICDDSQAQRMAAKCEKHWAILHGEKSFQARKFRFHSFDPYSSFGEVESCFGEPVLTEIDQLLLCNVIVTHDAPKFCCQCLQKRNRTSEQCLKCAVVFYCSERCKSMHAIRHEKFCSLAAQFTNF